MGILNLTPDSFYDGGKFMEEKAMVSRVKKMLEQGASIIDIGAMSSRPGAKFVSEQTEIKRLVPAIRLLVKKFPGIIISVDTFRASVAEKSLDAGASIINDISAGAFDKNIFSVAGRNKVPYILMHMKGTPQTMQKNPVYKNVTIEVLDFFQRKIEKIRKAGVHDIIVDPGFGFGKTVDHNFELLHNLEIFKITGCPVLAGLSRKSMINKVLSVSPGKALNGTTVLNTLALLRGAVLLRVHDVKEAREAIRLVNYFKKPFDNKQK